MPHPPKAAWVSAALGIGMYEENISAADLQSMHYKSKLNTFRTHAVPMRSQFLSSNAIRRDEDNALYFLFTNDADNHHDLYLSEEQLLFYVKSDKKSFFSFTYPPVGDPKPMQLPERIRVDQPLNDDLLSATLKALKTHYSLTTVQPL